MLVPQADSHPGSNEIAQGRYVGAPPAQADDSRSTISFARSLAVVIGINDYADPIPALKTPGNDAHRMAEVLQQQQKCDVLPPLTADVTRRRLVDLFSETLPALDLGSGDRLLVYFAGHGTERPSAGGEPEYYLVPQDAHPDDPDSFLPMRLMRDELLKLKCRHLLLVLDCCFAGGFGRLRSIDDPPDKIYRQRFDFYVRSPAWQVIASAAHDETALDTAGGYVFGRRAIGDEADHSPFASALFAALEGEADVNPASQEGEPDGDGLITATELYTWVRDRVQALAGKTHRQSPGLWPLPNHQAGEFVFRNPERAMWLEDALPLTVGANPYRGLSSYDEQHSHLFFGRAKQIAALVEKVAAQPFVAVLGVSGTGKSSLAKAGLIPALGGSHCAGEPSDPRLVGETRWQALPPFRPTAEPVVSLAKILTEHLPDYVDQEEFLASDPASLATVVAAWSAAHPGARLALVIDQFEELVTLCDDPAQRQHFQALLANALEAANGALRVIVTLRTDFEPAFAQSPLAAFWHREARFVALPMSQDDLRQVILGPAWTSEIYFDPHALVDELINEVIQAPGGLPLLSFALSEMYLRYIESGRADRTLRREDYDAVGGVIGSLRASANKIWDDLDFAQQATMERLMLRMIAVGGGEVARRRVAWEELNYSEEENKRRNEVIRRLEESRLVVRDKNAQWVEPAHDALVSGWDRLMEWKLKAASYLPLQRELAPVALRWQTADAKTSSGLLWDKDPRLPQVEETLWPTDSKQKGVRSRLRWMRQVLLPKTNTPADTQWLNGAELKFIQTSVTYRARSFRRIILFTALVIVTLFSSFLFAAYQARAATTQRNSAQREARRARAGEFAAGAQAELPGQVGDPSLALLLAKQAVTTTVSHHEEVPSQVRATLRDAILIAPPWRLTLPTHRHAGPVNYAEFSPDGRALVSASDDQTARVWDATTGQQEAMLVGHVGAVHTAHFGPTAASVVTAGEDGAIMIWDTASGTLRLRLIGHAGPVRSAVYSPDGKSILSAGDDGTARMWDAETGRQEKQLDGHTGGVRSANFSPDGRWIVTAGQDRTIRIWEATSGRSIRQLSGHEAPVNTAVFSPDGLHVLTASDDKTARLWDRQTGQEVQRLIGHTGSVTSAAFDPQGTTIVTTGINRSVRTWDTRTGQELRQYNRHSGRVNSAVFSPDGLQLLTTSDDQTVRRWGLDSQEDEDITGHSEWLRSAAFDPTAARVVTAGDDATARLWDATTGGQLIQLKGHAASVNSASFSPTGEYVVTASDDKTARLWNPQTGEELRRFSGHTNPVNAAAFSPDGTFIVTASDDGTALVWDVETGDRWLALTGHGVAIRGVVYSHRGTYVATASIDRTGRIWNADSGETVRILEGHSDMVNTVAFSPDDTRVVTASDDETARVWDVETGKELLRLVGHAGSVFTAEFSPDGRHILTSGEDTIARIWDAESGLEVERLTGHERPVQSATYSHDGRLIVTASRDRTARIWEALAGQESRRLEHEDQVNFAAYSRDGKRIVTAGNDWRAKVWNADTGELIGDLAGHRSLVHSATFDGNGERLVTASYDFEARVWDVATGQELLPAPLRHENYVETAVFSPDDRYILTASDDTTARVWDADTGQEVMSMTGHTLAVNSASYRDDGKRVVTASDDKTARTWDAKTGQEILRLNHDDAVYFASYNTHGTRIITAGRDGIARVWDAETGHELLQLKGHSGPIFSAVYSPDDQFIVTASDDKTARLWRAATGIELRRLASHNGPVYSAMYRPDGQQIVTAGRDRVALIWPAASIENQPIEKLLEQADQLIQRDPPLLTSLELSQFGDSASIGENVPYRSP